MISGKVVVFVEIGILRMGVPGMAIETTGSGAPGSVRQHRPAWSRPRVIDNYAWLALGALAVIGFALLWKLTPHEREGQTLGQFVAKIVVFVLAIAAVSLVPRLRRTGFLVACAPFLAVLGFVIPKLTYYFLQGPQAQPQYYTYLWTLLYPGIILSLCLAWRQGGGSPGHTMKIGLMGLVLVFSGFLEWMWFRANPNMNYYDMKTIPHIQVIIGHFPSYAGLFIYMICHVPIFVAIGIAPFDRWLDRLRGARSRRPDTA
jgi:tryptophan-rich sensory protein